MSTKRYREILIDKGVFVAIVSKILGSSEYKLGCTDYSYGFLCEEMVTPYFSERL